MFGLKRKSIQNGAESSRGSILQIGENDKITGFKTQFAGTPFTIDSFQFLSTVGTGTFGRVRVVKVKDSKGVDPNFPFALKILKKSEIIRLKQVDHMKAERQILRMVSHPFLVNMLTVFQDEKRIFLLLEYVNGGELFSYLRKEGKIPNDHARFYSAEIVLAFQYLHGLEIVYRDLKPENLLIDHAGHTKITDFGFAKVVEDKTWTLCGTPEYLAPEIIQSKGHGKAVDWWALGILLYEMLAGYPPFYDENPFGIYQKVLLGRVEYPKHMDVKVKDLVKKLLTQDQAKRLGRTKKEAEDVKGHKWFKGVDWDVCLHRGLPPAFVPEVKGMDDTSMFDRYPESIEDSAPIPPPEEQALFTDFHPAGPT
mmetsp:Transcript_74632/g.199076  ORF Transcript_74632/g.199076 Transcript_74632/m.199076 type:complete len:367 (-) Transcript_74632:136-1236(-)